MTVQLHSNTESGQYTDAPLNDSEDRVANDENLMITRSCVQCLQHYTKYRVFGRQSLS